MATRGEDVRVRYFGASQLWRNAIFPALIASGALAIAILAAVFTAQAGEAGRLNIFVETLSGTSATFIGNASPILPLGFAFAAGMVSAFNPCGFAMFPAYLGLYLGANEQDGARVTPVRRLGKALLVGGTVTAGFVALFGVAGILFGGGARFLVNIFPWLGLAVGALLVLTGAWLAGGSKLYSGFAAEAAGRIGTPSEVGTRGFFLFGVSYGAASLSCTLPIFLAVVGSAMAVSGLLAAVGQFILYAFGMGIVILLLTLALALFKGAMVGMMRKALPYIQPASAAFMVLAGSYIVYYWLTIGGLLSEIA